MVTAAHFTVITCQPCWSMSTRKTIFCILGLKMFELFCRFLLALLKFSFDKVCTVSNQFKPHHIHIFLFCFVFFSFSFIWSLIIVLHKVIYRGYYTVARRYAFYVRVAETIYCSCHENIKFISSSHRVMFFLVYGD